MQPFRPSSPPQVRKALPKPTPCLARSGTLGVLGLLWHSLAGSQELGETAIPHSWTLPQGWVPFSAWHQQRFWGFNPSSVTEGLETTFPTRVWCWEFRQPGTPGGGNCQDTFARAVPPEQAREAGCQGMPAPIPVLSSSCHLGAPIKDLKESSPLLVSASISRSHSLHFPGLHSEHFHD